MSKILLHLSFVAVMLSSACGGSGAGLENSARVRVFNAVDGQSAISVGFVDSSANLVAKSTVANYGSVSPSPDAIVNNKGLTNQVLGSAGTLFTGPSTVYRVNSIYTLYVAGVSGNFKALAEQDDPNRTAPGTIGLRILNVGAKTGALDVYVQPAGQRAPKGKPLVSNLAFGIVAGRANSNRAFDGNGYVQIPVQSGGTYDVFVTTAGSKTPTASASFTFDQGVHYTAAVFDMNGGGIRVALNMDSHG